MAILFVGSTADDLGGACVPTTLAGTFDADFTAEAAKVITGISNTIVGFNLVVPPPSGAFWCHFLVHTLDISTTLADGYWLTLTNDGTNIARLDMNDGTCYATAFGDTTVNGASFGLNSQTLYTIDLKLEVGANITLSVYVNGVLQSTATAANTGAKPQANTIVFDHFDMTGASNSPGIDMIYSEMIITDDEPTLGWRLSTLTPNVAGTYAAWAGGIPDILSPSDGLSISSGTAGQKESWTLSTYNGPATSSGIRAVVNRIASSKGVGGPTQIRPFIRHAATDVPLTAYTPDGETKFVTMDNNPQTALPWDTADFAALEIGVESIA